MLSKSISDRSAPHQGMGLAWKCLSALSRNFRIHAGSDFMSEISSTTRSERPRLGVKTEWAGSLQPKRYPLVSSFRCSSWVTAMTRSSLHAAHGEPYRLGRIQTCCSGPLFLDRHPHQRSVLGPGPVVVLDPLVAEQLG